MKILQAADMPTQEMSGPQDLRACQGRSSSVRGGAAVCFCLSMVCILCADHVYSHSAASQRHPVCRLQARHCILLPWPGCSDRGHGEGECTSCCLAHLSVLTSVLQCRMSLPVCRLQSSYLNRPATSWAMTCCKSALMVSGQGACLVPMTHAHIAPLLLSHCFAPVSIYPAAGHYLMSPRHLKAN